VRGARGAAGQGLHAQSVLLLHMSEGSARPAGGQRAAELLHPRGALGDADLRHLHLYPRAVLVLVAEVRGSCGGGMLVVHPHLLPLPLTRGHAPTRALANPLHRHALWRLPAWVTLRRRHSLAHHRGAEAPDGGDGP